MSVLIVGGTYREVLEVEGERIVRYGGGGLTAAIAAARVAQDVRLASFVGTEDADAIHLLLGEAGVSTEDVFVLPGASGTFAFNAQSLGEAPRPLYRPAEAVPATVRVLPEADFVLLFGMPDFDAVASGWVRRSTVAAATFIWDRQGWLSRARGSQTGAALGALRQIYLANYDEAIEERGVPPSLPPPGFHVAVIKDGPWGGTVTYADGRITTFPALHVEQRSPVGSGDVFGGVLTGSLASGQDIDDAVRPAAAAGALAVSTGENLLKVDAIEQIDRLAENVPATFVSRDALSRVRVIVRPGPSYPDQTIAAVIEMRFRHLGLTVVNEREGDIEILVGSGEGTGKSELTIRLGEAEAGGTTSINQLDLLINAVVDWVRSRVGS